MNAFVAYLVVNDRHLERFAVSLWTLRQWWSGKVLVLANRPEDVARLAAVAGGVTGGNGGRGGDGIVIITCW